MGKVKYTEEQIKILREYYPEYGAKYVADMLNTSVTSVMHKVIRLKIRRNTEKHCKIVSCKNSIFKNNLCEEHYIENKQNQHAKSLKCSIRSCTNSIFQLETGVCQDHENNLPELSKQERARIKYYRNYKLNQKNRMEKREKFSDQLHSKFHSQYVENLRNAIKIYGSKCEICGSSDIVTFEWHHLKRVDKFECSHGIVSKIVKNNAKLENLILVCANCHIYENLKSGTGKQGISNLKCFSHDYIPKTIDEKRILKLKTNALQLYSCKCQQCQNPDLLVLQWHHRVSFKPRENDKALFTRIKKYNSILEDVLLLCANCHTKQDLIDRTTTGGSVFAEAAQ